MDRTRREMLSVGIDVGTTTTQVVFSRLKVRNVGPSRARASHRDRCTRGLNMSVPSPSRRCSDRMRSMSEQPPRNWFTEEYVAAGIDPTDVETGAVIITGETARRERTPITVLDGPVGLGRRLRRDGCRTEP
jgi:ethanolamine utilization protein EutA